MTTNCLRARLRKSFWLLCKSQTHVQLNLRNLAYAWKSTTAYTRSLRRLRYTAKHTASAYATYHAVAFSIKRYRLKKKRCSFQKFALGHRIISPCRHATTRIDHVDLHKSKIHWKWLEVGRNQNLLYHIGGDEHPVTSYFKIFTRAFHRF